MPCMAEGDCGRLAVVAVHLQTDHTVLLRTDHVGGMWSADARCLECALQDVEVALASTTPTLLDLNGLGV